MKTVKDIEEILDNVRIPSDKEVKAAGRRFDRRLRRMRMRPWIIRGAGVAAVLCCGLVLAFLWQREEEKVPEIIKVAKVIEIDHKFTEPTLVLADGSQLNLREEKKDLAVQKPNIRITDDHLTYDTMETTREIVYNMLIVPSGCTYNVTLADGTVVTLNAESRLKYPEEFVGEVREVELLGEAYFNVAKSGNPFVVNVDSSKIRVYGTQFNVKGRRHKMIETVLVKGKIGFKSPGCAEIRVVPGEQVTYNVVSGEVKVEQVDVHYAMGWLENVFRYRNRTLAFVLEDIAAWYGVKFEISPERAKDEITMNLTKEIPVEEVLQFIEKMTNCKFIKERGHYIVQ